MDQHHPSPPPSADPAFMAFIADRLAEEHTAAARRSGETGGGPVPQHTDRGVRLLEELMAGLMEGREPDPMSRDLLVVAFSRHPDFRPEWNRWRQS